MKKFGILLIVFLGLQSELNADNHPMTEDEFWNEIKQVRRDLTGRNDIEFNKKVDYCRWWSESVVRHKEEDTSLSNVVSYSSKCMKHLTDLTNQTLKDVTGSEDHNSHVLDDE